MQQVNHEHEFSIVESPDLFRSGALISIDKLHAEKGFGNVRLCHSNVMEEKGQMHQGTLTFVKYCFISQSLVAT